MIVSLVPVDYYQSMENEVSRRVDDAYRRTTWGNTTVTAEGWRQILDGDDEEQRQKLFVHLFLESADGSDVRELFPQEEIQGYLSRMDRPLPRPHVEQRRRVWRWVYCGIREAIPELDWPAPQKSKGVWRDGNHKVRATLSATRRRNGDGIFPPVGILFDWRNRIEPFSPGPSL